MTNHAEPLQPGRRPPFTTLVFQQNSLQYSDTPAQQESDVADLFKLQPHVMTGTEAGADRRGNNMNRELIRDYAEQNGYRTSFFRDCFVCVRRSIVKPRSVDLGGVLVADNDEKRAGRGNDVGFAWLSFEHVNPKVGRISVAATHYPTKGRRPGDPNYPIAQRCGRKLEAWAREAGAGVDLAFVAGDFNRPDDQLDWFPGGVLLSAGDEAGKHPGTGHGPIDGHASLVRDTRVELGHTMVLDDKRFPQYSDHFVVVSSYRIAHLKTA